jgi:DMSO reductase anchor subunit
MHPAGSVIGFTTASGLGYGFLAAWAAFWLGGVVPPSLGWRLLAFALAFALIIGGLLASTFHLGHPERAWRALSQWRSSWLSREGVAAIFFFLPGGLFALIGSFWPAALDGGAGKALLGLVVLAAGAVVLTTGMIYAQLKAIPAWHTALTPAVYLALAGASGSTLLATLMGFARDSASSVTLVALTLIAIAGLLKAAYWRRLDSDAAAATAASATGLGKGDKVAMVGAPHTEANYIMKEMGFVLARENAATLRTATVILAFVAPALLLWLGGLRGGGVGAISALAAFMSLMIGIICERWLFFAEARHVVTLFYGSQKV